MATTAQQVAELQKQNNDMYIQSAREQMAFQERMSNTAHQREVSDLIKSGLNPVLSATGGQGATTPNGAQADVDSQSMVSYLLNEMNNENARQINSAQVAAQKYAAEMSYKAAQVAANAQIQSAHIAASTQPLGFLAEGLTNPDSPAGKLAFGVADALGIDLYALTGQTRPGANPSSPAPIPSVSGQKQLNAFEVFTNKLKGIPDHFKAKYVANLIQACETTHLWKLQSLLKRYALQYNLSIYGYK